MEQFNQSSASLPLWGQLPASAVLVLVLLFALRIADSNNARFVVFACWLRFMLSAFHAYTYKEVGAGLSGNALGSAFLFALGVYLLPRKVLLQPSMIPAYLLLAIMTVSALANGDPKSAFEPMTKVGLFVVIALHGFEALRRGDMRRVGMAIILGFAPLMLFQLVSLLLGVSKSGSGGIGGNYIGGYDHEAAFSVALMALFVVSTVAPRIPLLWRIGAVSGSIIGIFLANYRTAILAMGPLLLYLVLKGSGSLFDKRLRPLVNAVVAGAIVVGAIGTLVASDRFADLKTIADSNKQIIRPPDEFSREDLELLSGRTFIWSNYFYTWKEEGRETQHLIGFGPDSWEARFKIYAHNTFVSYLFEYGYLGVLALCLWVGTGLGLAWQTGPNRWKLLAAHLSFLALNLATMPMWMVEGLILYGLLWGYTLMYRTRPYRISSSGPQQSRLRTAAA